MFREFIRLGDKTLFSDENGHLELSDNYENLKKRFVQQNIIEYYENEIKRLEVVKGGLIKPKMEWPFLGIGSLVAMAIIRLISEGFPQDPDGIFSMFNSIFNTPTHVTATILSGIFFTIFTGGVVIKDYHARREFKNRINGLEAAICKCKKELRKERAKLRELEENQQLTVQAENTSEKEPVIVPIASGSEKVGAFVEVYIRVYKNVGSDYARYARAWKNGELEELLARNNQHAYLSFYEEAISDGPDYRKTSREIPRLVKKI